MTTVVKFAHATGTDHRHEVSESVGMFKQALCGARNKDLSIPAPSPVRDCDRCISIHNKLVSKAAKGEL